MVAAADLLNECLGSAFALRQRALIDRWADDHRKIASRDAAEPGPWRTDRVAYMRRPMRLAAHPLVRQVTLQTGTQLSKSETLETIKLFLIAGGAGDRGTMMAMYPTEDFAVSFNRDRFLPSVRACEPARAKLGLSPHDAKNLKIDFDDWVVWYAGSNSDASKLGRSVKVLVLDEIDKFRPGWESVFDRNKAWADYKRLMASSPTLEDAGISKAYKSGSRERYYVPCPHCGTFQRLVFGRPGHPGGLHWEGGGHASEEQAKATAHYVCRVGGCGGKIFDWHKPEMNRAGVWVATPEDGGEPTADRIERARERDRIAEDDPYGTEVDPPAHASFQISSLYSPFGGATFGEMAAAFVKARGVMTPDFVNGWLGEEWKVAQDRTEVAELRRLCVSAGVGGYRVGECQTGVLGITAAVDVQADRVYVEVRGWGEKGEDTWLIEALELPRTKGANLIELDQWVFGGANGGARTWKTIAGGLVALDSLVIDSGHFTDETYTAVRRVRSRGLRAYACKGQGLNRTPMKTPLVLSVLDKWPDGTPMPGGVHFLLINSDYWKTRVLGQIKGRVEEGIRSGEESGEERGSMGGEGTGAVPGFYLPENAGGCLEDYLDQMTAEQRVKSFGTARRSGPEQYSWAMREGRTENHFWDCCCYNFALAEARGVRNLVRNPPAPSTAKDEPQRPPSGMRLKIRQ